MRKRKIENDPLARLFASARSERVPDGGFTQRVVGRIVLPPSRNTYRIPTLVTACASVLVIVWMAFSDVNITGLAERLREPGSGVRLVPKSWTIPHTFTEDTNTSEHANL